MVIIILSHLTYPGRLAGLLAGCVLKMTALPGRWRRKREVRESYGRTKREVIVKLLLKKGHDVMNEKEKCHFI